MPHPGNELELRVRNGSDERFGVRWRNDHVHRAMAGDHLRSELAEVAIDAGHYNGCALLADGTECDAAESTAVAGMPLKSRVGPETTVVVKVP